MSPPEHENPPDTTTPVRVDKWLWATRSYKTRSLAGKACSTGNVRINGLVESQSEGSNR